MQALRATFGTMNTPTPNFMSRIGAASTQVISRVDENNAAISAVNLPPSSTQNVSLAAGVSNDSGPITHAQPGALDPQSAIAPPPTPPSLGAMNVQPALNAPLSFPTDSKGLDLAVEASESLDPSSELTVMQGGPLGPDFSRILVTATELGAVGKLSDWLEERLGSAVVRRWGSVPGSKTLANLWNELVEGESSLEDGRPPTRMVNVACVAIRNNDGEALEEAYQEMSDGSRRQRNRPLSEKMKPGEDVRDACARGIAEELGSDLVGRVDLLQETYARREEERDSISYPGLPTRFVIHSMEARIQHVLPAEFSTGENESCHVGDAMQPGPVTVKRHFWRWVRGPDPQKLAA